MMLNVPDVDDLMLEFGHPIPTEPARWITQVQRVNGTIN